jgi:hypothetical protein
MAFTMQCGNKGCCQIQQPYLDPETDKVYCSLCDNEITQATYFAKQQIKSLRQFKEKKKLSFSTKCPKCSLEDRPFKKDNKYTCKGCKCVLDLPLAFRAVLDAFLQSANKEL